MATLTEATVKVELKVTRTMLDDTPAAEPRLIAQAISYTAEGLPLRMTLVDITDQVSAARRTGAADLLADIEARIKTLWSIP
jgi:hypothetical protein